MSGRHRCLLIDDDPNIAVAITQYMDVIDFDCVSVASLEEARPLIDEGDFCLILTDLAILPTKSATKPEIALGYMVIEYARKRFPKRNEAAHLLPILVLSTNDDHAHFRDALHLGIDDFLKKPLAANRLSLKDTVHEWLRKAGRERHTNCAEIMRMARGDVPANASPTAPATTEGIRIALPGTSTKRDRTLVIVNGRGVDITNKAFSVLFRLAVGRRRGEESVSKAELGARDGEGFRGTSVMQDQLGPYVGGAKLYKSIRGEGYALADEVTIESMDLDAIAKHDEHRVRALAEALQKPQKNSRRR